jgi:hypothetical protein
LVIFLLCMQNWTKNSPENGFLGSQRFIFFQSKLNVLCESSEKHFKLLSFLHPCSCEKLTFTVVNKFFNASSTTPSLAVTSKKEINYFFFFSVRAKKKHLSLLFCLLPSKDPNRPFQTNSCKTFQHKPFALQEICLFFTNQPCQLKPPSSVFFLTCLAVRSPAAECGVPERFFPTGLSLQ